MDLFPHEAPRLFVEFTTAHGLSRAAVVPPSPRPSRHPQAAGWAEAGVTGLIVLLLTCHGQPRTPGPVLLSYRQEVQARQDELKPWCSAPRSNLFPGSVISLCPFPASGSPEEKHTGAFCRGEQLQVENKRKATTNCQA